MNHRVRTVRAAEWQQVKELRLDALRDPIAHLAFLDTHAQAAAQPDGYWRERTSRTAEGGGPLGRQFVAEDQATGRWLGSLVGLIEQPDSPNVFGGAPPAPQVHVVGVFVRPEARGTGIALDLFRAVTDWAWSLTEPVVTRARLFVHEDNGRARALYRKAGFGWTGERIPQPNGLGHELELALPRPGV